jgi:hypothetical protein
MSKFTKWLETNPDLTRVTRIEGTPDDTFEVTIGMEVHHFGPYENPYRMFRDARKLERMAVNARRNSVAADV